MVIGRIERRGCKYNYFVLFLPGRKSGDNVAQEVAECPGFHSDVFRLLFEAAHKLAKCCWSGNALGSTMLSPFLMRRMVARGGK